VVDQIAFGAEEAELDEGAGDETQRVRVEQQYCCALEVAAFAELELVEQPGIGFSKRRCIQPAAARGEIAKDLDRRR